MLKARAARATVCVLLLEESRSLFVLRLQLTFQRGRCGYGEVEIVGTSAAFPKMAIPPFVLAH